MAEPTSPTPPTPAPPAPASGRAVRAFLAGDRTPMWFTLFALFAGAMGTYFIAPQVNAQFEAQKIKTDFVIRNYNDLRLKMEDFSALYTTATQKQIAGDSLQQEFEKLQQMTARISAQNTALLPMFVKESGPRSIAEVHQALNGLLQVLIDNAGKDLTSPQASQAYTASVLAAQQRLTRPCSSSMSALPKSASSIPRKPMPSWLATELQENSPFPLAFPVQTGNIAGVRR